MGSEALPFYGWKANPWVQVIEFELRDKTEEEIEDETEDDPLEDVALVHSHLSRSDGKSGCEYCFYKSRLAFRCDVRSPQTDGTVKDIPVPVFHCPYCGSLLKKAL